MKTLKGLLISAALLALPLSALADGGHHGDRSHGYQKRSHMEHSQRDHVRRDHRDYRDFRHHAPERHHVHRERVYAPAAPVIYSPPVIPVRQGVAIHGNIHLPM